MLKNANIIILFAFFISFYPFCLSANSISVSGSPAAMTINTATAGSQPNNATNSSTTYSVAVTTSTIRRITGKINTAMPANVTLSVQLAIPGSGTSAGSVSMTTTAKNLVTGIPGFTNSSGKAITYTLSATAAAAKVTGATRTLTLTIQ